MPFIEVQSKRLEYQRLLPTLPLNNKSTVVLLHEGLGSISMWRDFPQKLANATGHEVLVYSRYGYGNSEPANGKGFPFKYMHNEGLLALPELLNLLKIENPILVGHSDGASISIIAAGGSSVKPKAVVVMAPHVMVEPMCFESIEQARELYKTSDLKEKLSKYHADVDSAFLGWNGVWLSPEFRQWNIEEYLPGITCPILTIQGFEDEYGTMAQLDAIADKATNAKIIETLRLNNCRHSPHKDHPEAVLNAINSFLKNNT